MIPALVSLLLAQTKDEVRSDSVVTGGALSTDASDDEVYVITIRQVEEVPGFHLIDDFAWPVHPGRCSANRRIHSRRCVADLSQLTWMTYCTRRTATCSVS